MEERKKVAIYVRLSEEDRNKQNQVDDSLSIQNQKSMLIKHAIENRWDIFNIYSDDDYAGSDRSRPEWNHLLQDAKDRKFEIVLCKTQSRFTRELEMVEKYIHGLFPIWGIRFVSIVDNADTANKGNKKSRQINGLVNEWYLEDMSENIRSVLTDRRKNGYHIGAFALYGYRKDPEKKGHLLIDEEAAEIVRGIFNMFASGYGKTAIARSLNARGIPNPTTYKLMKGIRRKRTRAAEGTLWKYYTISDMLVNEIYIGNMVQGKYGSVSYKTRQNRPKPKEQWIRVVGTHAPIIERNLWNRVQEMIALKSKPWSVGEVGIFAKKTKCMHCGYVLRSCKIREYRYLKCPTRHTEQKACIGAFVPQRELEEIVLQQLKDIMKQYLDVSMAEELITQKAPDMERNKIHLQQEITEYEQKSELIRCSLRQCYVDKVKGMITEKDYSEFSTSFHHDVEAIEKLLVDKKQLLEQLQKRKKDILSKREILEKYLGIEQLNHEIMNTLIDYIEVGRREGSGRSGNLPVVIHWKF